MVRVQRLFSLDLKIAEKLKSYSKANDIPMSWIVENQIRKYLKSKGWL